MRIFYLFFFLFNILFHAQTISGIVYSKDTQRPIPFAKIGIENDDMGSIADEKGMFQLNVEGLNDKNLKIEVSGFQSFQQSVQTISKNELVKFYLQLKFNTIEEVKIIPKKYKDENWGINTKTKNVVYVVDTEMNKEKYLSETAVEFTTSKRAKIKNIHLNIAKLTSDKPVTMRYTIYDEKDGLPNTNILFEDLIVHLTPDKIVNGTLTLNVEDKNIWVKGKFFVGAQFLNEFNGSVRISAALFKKGYLRKFFSEWEKMSLAAPAINIDVKVEKGRNKTEDEQTGKVDLTTLLPDLSVYKEESLQSQYGKNETKGNFIKLEDAHLYYETYGSGEPIFLLHGNGGSIQDFYKAIPQLAKKYKVIAIDTRAQGKSTNSYSGSFSYQLFADDVKAITDELNLNKINIVGWSDGGNTGLEFAIKYPSKLNQLIIVGANSNPNGIVPEIGDLMKSEWDKKIQSQQVSDNEKLLEIMLKEPNITVKQLNSIPHKVMVIAGEHDVIKREHTQLIAKNIKNSYLKIYKAATHFIPFQDAEELVEDILKFLKN